MSIPFIRSKAKIARFIKYGSSELLNCHGQVHEGMEERFFVVLVPMGWWHRLMNPPVFQGGKRKSAYFEGWYYKQVSHGGEHAISFIPGIALGADSHAFLQIIDGRKKMARYIRYDLKDFRAADKTLDIRLGPHRFTDRGILFDDPDLQGELRFKDMVPWTSTLMRPGIMGWYSYMPFMQCYHGLVSANHSLEGSVQVSGEKMDFTGGRGYIEKDWGKSFPRSWIWTQCNNFSEELSVMASVAHIPWLTTHFIGFLAIVWYRGKLKVYTSYTGAKYNAAIHDDTVQLRFWDKQSELILSAKQGEGADLRSPLEGDMKGKVNESLEAEIELSFRDGPDRRVKSIGSTAGLEVAGDVTELLTS